MKKKYLAAILGIMMATASVTACGAATTETTTNTAESSDNTGTKDGPEQMQAGNRAEAAAQMRIKKILMRKM